MKRDLVFWDWFVFPELWVGGHLSPTHLGSNDSNNVLGRRPDNNTVQMRTGSRRTKCANCVFAPWMYFTVPAGVQMTVGPFEPGYRPILWTPLLLYFWYTTLFTNIDTDQYFVHSWLLFPSFNVSIVIVMGFGFPWLLLLAEYSTWWPRWNCIGLWYCDWYCGIVSGVISKANRVGAGRSILRPPVNQSNFSPLCPSL